MINGGFLPKAATAENGNKSAKQVLPIVHAPV
jgi:hypothetical protein